MTASIPLLEDVKQRLQRLLEQAQKLKSSSSIEPPLPVANFTGELGLPVQNVSLKLHQSTVEIAAKQALQAQLAREDRKFDDIWNLLDIISILGDQDQCDPVSLWYLIEDLLDSQDIEGCRSVFDYLESRREYLVAKHFQKVSLVILRACNELLRRLSKAEDAVFCGRVFIFVFQCFPLGDKSAVNRHGDYNSGNVTVFDDIQLQEQSSSNNDTVMEDAPANEQAVNAENSGLCKAMDELYSTFWGLQKTFAYPPSVFDPKFLEEFKKSFQATLDKFKDMKSVLSSTKFEERQNSKRNMDETDYEDNSKILNPKYLTSRELFELELSDLAFRRHILVQALILIHFLLSFTEKAKKNMSLRVQQKTKFTLSEEDTKWALETRRAITTALRVGSDGAAFLRVVDTVLARDKNWVRWKEENCPEITRPALLPNAFSKSASDGKSTWGWKRLRTTPLGSLDLAFLSDSKEKSGVDRLLQSERLMLPEAEILVKKVEGADLDLDFATTEEEKDTLEETKSGNTWRALRLVSTSRLSRFGQLGDDGQLSKLLGDEQDRENQEHIEDPEQEQEQEQGPKLDENVEVPPEPAEEAQSAQDTAQEAQ